VTNHPIIPPYELVEQWRKEPECTDGNKLVTMVTMTTDRLMQLCEKFAQHGADQELEACCEWIADWYGHGCNEVIGNLRTDRRPKPLSLKEQALLAIDTAVADYRLSADAANVVRRALEQLK
jgi:hypothetical protein